MPFVQTPLSIPLNGTGSEIPALNITDGYNSYLITGTNTTIGNYAIVPTGTPQIGTTFLFKYRAITDITTNSNTFAIFGVSLNQTQLNCKLDIECYYNGSAWTVTVLGSLDQACITSTNIASIGNTPVALVAWSKTGNSGTTAGTNFVGTTDAIDLVFKVNSVESGRIDVSGINTSFGRESLLSITSGTNNNAFGAYALNANTTGIGNIGAGSSSLFSNIGGLYNTGIGTSSLSDNLSGNYNFGGGYNAIHSNTTGSYNTGIGADSGANSISGSHNLYAGYNSGNQSTIGSYNTIIGALADVTSANAANRIALGYGAVASADYEFAVPSGITSVNFQSATVTSQGLSITSKGINTTAGDSATVNSVTGRIRKDTSGSTFVLTSSYITTNSIILLTPANAAIDATATHWTVSAGVGSATITFNAAPTSNFDLNFWIIN